MTTTPTIIRLTSDIGAIPAGAELKVLEVGEDGRVQIPADNWCGSSWIPASAFEIVEAA